MYDFLGLGQMRQMERVVQQQMNRALNMPLSTLMSAQLNGGAGGVFASMHNPALHVAQLGIGRMFAGFAGGGDEVEEAPKPNAVRDWVAAQREMQKETEMQKEMQDDAPRHAPEVIALLRELVAIARESLEVQKKIEENTRRTAENTDPVRYWRELTGN